MTEQERIDIAYLDTEMCIRDRFTPGSPEPVSGDDAAMRRHDRGGERYRRPGCALLRGLPGMEGTGPVSYTHLDVYKRQLQDPARPAQVHEPFRRDSVLVGADRQGDVYKRQPLTCTM